MMNKITIAEATTVTFGELRAGDMFRQASGLYSLTVYMKDSVGSSIRLDTGDAVPFPKNIAVIPVVGSVTIEPEGA
jgi:hypothetical protein